MQLLVDNLSKTYPNGTRALDHVNIEIKAGMFGLLGPNGAGKSTLMRTIATLQEPDQGRVVFNGQDISKDKISLRKVLGYLPQEFGVYPRMSADRLLDYLAQLKGITSRKERQKLIDRSLEITNLTEVRKKSVSGYSGGMKQRFGIAQLLLNSPSLIIVDEPTAGLDPKERVRFLNILREIGRENIVIFSTHIVEDIKDLCTDMAILNEGQIKYHRSPDDALAELHEKIYTYRISQDELPLYGQNHQVLSSHYNPDHSVQIRVFSMQRPSQQFQSVSPTLEDVYFTHLNDRHV